MKSRRPGRVRVTLRRAGSHLTRTTARWGYLLTLVCILGYALVPEDWSDGDALRQFLLVLASVAAGAIVLPELPSNLWSLDVHRVRNLVPDTQRAQLAETLISAESEDGHWNDLVWRDALRPLLDASRTPSRYVRDMDYDVSVHLERSVQVDGAPLTCHLVSVDSKSHRVLVPAGVDPAMWISVARTERALGQEFDQPGCLAREIVPLDGLTGADWQRAAASVCLARLFVGGENVPLTTEAIPELPDVVRWRTPAGYEPPSGSTTVRIMFDFVTSTTVDTFPVMFSGYYCAGTTDISLRLYDEARPSELTCHEFIGRALADQRGPQSVERSTEMFQQVTFTTGSDSILWPGSGVLFRWWPRT